MLNTFKKTKETTFSYDPNQSKGPKYYKIQSTNSNKPSNYVLLVDPEETVPTGCCTIQ